MKPSNKFIQIIFLIVITALLYSSILSYKYTGGDFFINLYGVTTGLTKIFSQPMVGELNIFPGNTTYRPVQSLSLYLDYKVSGSNPLNYSISYQLSNLILHIVVVILLYCFVWQLFQNEKIAFLSSFIFALWPGNMWTVPFVTRRPDILMAIFILLTLMFLDRYLKSKRRRWQLLAIFASFLAYLSKGSGVVLAVLIFFYIIFRTKKVELKKLIKEFLPFVLMLALYFLVRIVAMGSIGRRAFEQTFSEYILSKFVIITSFFERLIYPIDIFKLDRIILFQYTIHSVSLLESLSLGMIFVATIYLITKSFKKKFSFKKIATNETFLLLWVLSFLAFYLFFGKVSLWYIYIAAVPFSIILASKLLSSESRILKISTGLLIFYFILASPIFSDYSYLKVKSEISQEMVIKVVEIFKDIPPNSRVYLINYLWRVDKYLQSKGIDEIETQTLLRMTLPERGWTIIKINDFTIEEVKEQFSVRYSVKREDNKVIVTSEGENIEFKNNPKMKIRDEKMNENFQEELLQSIEVLTFNKSKQRISIDNLGKNDYLVIFSAENSKINLEKVRP